MTTPTPQFDTLREAYAAVYDCRPEAFERRVFWRCLYPHAGLLAWWMWWVEREFFRTDLEAVEALGEARCEADFRRAIDDLENHGLVERSLRCAEEGGLNTLVLVGGVAANRRLRNRLGEQATTRGIHWQVAPLAYCTDNAAMIGRAALQRLMTGQSSSIRLGVAARFPLEEANRLYDLEPCF